MWSKFKSQNAKVKSTRLAGEAGNSKLKSI